VARGQRRRIAVLMPAHNEAAVLRTTIDSATSQLLAGDRLVVVADNCSDATAAIARQAGAEVVERQDSLRRGKGFALDAGVRYLESSPPDVVIVLDADCEIMPGALEELARVADATGRPVQALYLMRMPDDPPPSVSVSVFAFLMKNWVRLRAMQRLHSPVLLTGTGMAFPWEIIRDVPLASGEIVEDMVLGLELVRRRRGPVFCEAARVYSDLPTDRAAANAQRTRWEHGYLGTALRFAPSLLWNGLIQRSVPMFLVGLDMLVPPLSLLVLVSLLACAVTLGTGWWTGDLLPFFLLVSAGMLNAVGIVGCWWRFAKDWIPIRLVLDIPGYVIRKTSIYCRFIGKRQTEWVRTQRSNES